MARVSWSIWRQWKGTTHIQPDWVSGHDREAKGVPTDDFIWTVPIILPLFSNIKLNKNFLIKYLLHQLFLLSIPCCINNIHIQILGVCRETFWEVWLILILIIRLYKALNRSPVDDFWDKQWPLSLTFSNVTEFIKRRKLLTSQLVQNYLYWNRFDNSNCV